MLKFIKDHLFDIIGWTIGVLGVIAAIIIEFIKDENDFRILYSLIIATETIVFVIGNWNLKIKYDYERNVSELKDKMEKITKELCDEKKTHLDDLEEIKKNEQKEISCIVSNYKNVSKLHNEFCNRIPEINEASYHILEILKESVDISEDIKKEEIIKSYNEFSSGLFELYKRYSTGLLSSVVTMIESLLRIRGLSYNVSATIKLLNTPWCPKTNGRNKIIVYTAFRDKKTYEEHEREIGVEKYTIDGNVDFSVCITKDQFIINNAHKNTESYLNEHIDFDAYYNCTVVVPIRVKQVDNSNKILGYLCCDCLNTDETIEVFNKETAQLLFSLAQIYSIFLETLESNWIDRIGGINSLPKSFLEIIYNKTFVGKN